MIMVAAATWSQAASPGKTQIAGPQAEEFLICWSWVGPKTLYFNRFSGNNDAIGWRPYSENH